MTTNRNVSAHVFAALSCVLALILLGLSFVPYPSIKPLADRLVADGELESFSPQLAQTLRIPCCVAGGLSLFAAVWSASRPKNFSRFLSLCLHGSEVWVRDLRQFMADLKFLRLSPLELTSIVVIGGLGLVARLILINRPIEYDEAYTVMAFAHSPLRILVSDYHVPNNHVFHSILVRIAVLLLGSQPWQIRMPVLLAGMLLVPFVYWLGRTLHSRDVGFLSAGIVAFLPRMVQSSVSARGYVLVALITVMAFLLASYLVRHRNLFAWSLLAVLCALGFHAVPIMLFPFGFLLLWMLMSTLDLGRDQYTPLEWGLHLVATGVMVVLLTLLLYSPILLSTGLKYIFPSSGVLHGQSLQSLLEGLPGLASGVITEWTRQLGPVWRGILLLGMLLSAFGARHRRKHRVHTMVALLPAVFVLLLIQRPNPLVRIWLWVIPFAAIWVSDGLETILRLVRRNSVGQWLSVVLLVSVLVGLASTGIHISRQMDYPDFEHPATRDVAKFLAPRLTSKSLLVVDYAFDAYVWYYLYLEGVVKPRIFRPHKDRPFDEVYALVATGAASCHDRKVLETLEVFGPDLGLLNLDEMHEVAQIDFMKICWIPSLHQ